VAQYHVSSHDGTTLTQRAGYEASNVADNRVSRKWRSTNADDEWLLFYDDVGSDDLSADMLFVVGHNLYNDTLTITWETNSSDSWGVPATTDTVSYTSYFLKEYPAATREDAYHRLRFQNSTNPDGYVSMGRVLLLDTYSMTNYPQSRTPRRIIDTSRKRKSFTGQDYTDEGVQYKQYNFVWPYITDTERTNLETIWELHGPHTPLVIDINTDDTTLDPVYGYIDEFELDHIVAWQWSCRILFTEAL
jgi:hypothetical protein